MDLLFYHRTLRRLVLIELKLGGFEPQDKEQTELYLRWLENMRKLKEKKQSLAFANAREQLEQRIE